MGVSQFGMPAFQCAKGLSKRQHGCRKSVRLMPCTSRWKVDIHYVFFRDCVDDAMDTNPSLIRRTSAAAHRIFRDLASCAARRNNNRLRREAQRTPKKFVVGPGPALTPRPRHRKAPGVRKV